MSGEAARLVGGRPVSNFKGASGCSKNGGSGDDIAVVCNWQHAVLTLLVSALFGRTRPEEWTRQTAQVAAQADGWRLDVTTVEGARDDDRRVAWDRWWKASRRSPNLRLRPSSRLDRIVSYRIPIFCVISYRIVSCRLWLYRAITNWSW